MNNAFNLKLYWFTLLLFSSCSLNSACGQASTDLESVRTKVSASLERVLAFPAVKLSGRYKTDPTLSYQITLQARGKSVWIERTRILEGAELERQKAIQQVMQCDLPHLLAFDGKKSYSFNPTLLMLEIETSAKAQGVIGNELLPDYWVRAYGSGVIQQSISRSTSNHKVEVLSDGIYKWSSDVIMEKFTSDQHVGFPHKEFYFDPKFDFLPTSYEYRNSKTNNVMQGKVEWAKSDSHWYPKHGDFKNGELNAAETWIDQISFDARACRLKFDDMESIVPFATKIMVRDADNKLLRSSYKGGADGETENQLRNIARQKLLSNLPNEK